VDLILLPRRHARALVIGRPRAATGRLSVSLSAAEVRRGIGLALQYSSGPQDVIALPHL
jgi:hypothetical protein